MSANDLLANRLTKGSDTYGWDVLNRMTSYNANTYQYRADGMRTKKTSSSASTTYRHDGQMGMQDVEVNGSTATVTDYALGARGIDAISKSVNGAAATVSFPLYDAHGNTIGTLARSGSSFTTANERYYDAWGTVNFGGTTGDPKGRYCASIGHKQDDESGLIYMRARYYEPSSGRFVSEDTARDGLNWFAYCSSNPINFQDFDGRSMLRPGSGEGMFYLQTAWFCVGNYLVYGAIALAFTRSIDPGLRIAHIATLLAASASAFSFALDNSAYTKSFAQRMADQLNLFGDIFLLIAGVLASIGGAVGKANTIACAAVIAAVIRDCQLLGALYGAIEGE